MGVLASHGRGVKRYRREGGKGGFLPENPWQTWGEVKACFR